MIQLYDEERETHIGDVSEEQLQFLIDQLEEESTRDTDYYISAPTIDMLAENGADASLVKLLRDALGGRDGFELGWKAG
jgi:processive 1,2-diacylglycerol beta-glucosyltransferase